MKLRIYLQELEELLMLFNKGDLTQRVEYRTDNSAVPSSNLGVATKLDTKLKL